MTRAAVSGAGYDVADVIGNVWFTDPFRHLEDESREVHAWQAAMNAETDAVLARLPGQSRLASALEPHLEACRLRLPLPGGDRWFVAEQTLDGTICAVHVAEPGSLRGRRLVAAAEIAGCDADAIDWYAPSPDGRWLALGVSKYGDEQSTMVLVDALSGGVVAPSVAYASGGRVAWLPDSRGLYCCAGRARDPESPLKFLYFVMPHAPARPLDTPLEMPDTLFSVQVSPDGRWLGIVGNPVAPRLFSVRHLPSGRWMRCAAPPDGEILHGDFLGDRYVALTTSSAPRGRIVSVPLDHLGDPDAWTVVFDQGQAVIRSLTIARRHLVLTEYVDGASRIRLLAIDGTEASWVPLPGTGIVSASGLECAQGGTDAPLVATNDELLFVFSTVDRAPALYRYDLLDSRLEMLTGPAIGIPGVSLEQRACFAPDGHRVPYDVIRGADAEADGPRPAVIVAYGGWNQASPARSYVGRFAPLLQAGGILVFAHVRGDATYGADQWLAGRRATKQRSFDDLFAVAQQLVADGTTLPKHLGVCGASNGGLLVGAAITQRPELFGAAVALVPLFDMGRFNRERYAEFFTWEYGDPRVAEEAAWLQRYSPYHQVVDGVEFPATLVVCGGRDVRCHPWHGRKMVAALRKANAGSRPILLRTHEDRGHGTAAELAPPWLIAEWLGFLMQEIGLDWASDASRALSAGDASAAVA